MKFAIITHVQHIKSENQYFGYAPYIREMNIWIKYADEVIIVAPIIKEEITAIHQKYTHSNINFFQVKEFSKIGFWNSFKALFSIPKILYTIYVAMSKADHIHLRCPGNVGLLGSIVQILFPKKKKTAKYAGNWDSKSNQPLSYRLQKWILSNTFLTKNMQVLVYGKWEDQSKNIKPFFTATYSEKEIKKSDFQKSDFLNGIKFLFVGTLSPGKQPLYALQIVHKLVQKGYSATIVFYGEGNQKELLKDYIISNNLQEIAILNGNQSKEVIEKAYQNCHFLILPSKSEGWPKVVAEAMFWNCLPIVTKISCVPYMLDNGERGVLLEENLDKDILKIQDLLQDENKYLSKVEKAKNWSRDYTLEFFEAEIKKLLL